MAYGRPLDPASNHLGFLLSLGLLPVACFDDDKEMASATLTETESSTATSDPSGAQSGTSTSGPTGTESSTSETSAPSSGSTSSGEFDVRCQTYAMNSVACDQALDYEAAFAFCIASVEGIAWGFGEPCASLYLEAALCDPNDCEGTNDRCWPSDEEFEVVCAIQIGSKCAAYGEAASLCGEGGLADEYAYLCQSYVSGSSFSGMPCGLATEDYYACLTATECAAWGGACAEESDARDLVCSEFPDPP